MSAYLSEQWAEELAKALNADEVMGQLVAGQEALLQMNITGGPGDGGAFFYLFDDGDITVGCGLGDSPDVIATMAYDDAVELARGELDGQMAILSGKMKTDGDIGKIISLGPALERLTAVQANLSIEY